MKGARLGGLLARGLIVGATVAIVVVAALLAWPGAGVGPSADARRIADLQRLSHAIEAFRLRQHVLPASLARLPMEPAAPIYLYDPTINRPYDYRPLGPLAYELCATFDAAAPDQQRDYWWHDGGRYCFALEMREGPKPPAPPAAPPAAEPAAPIDEVPGPPSETLATPPAPVPAPAPPPTPADPPR
ncbi:MAG: hypothetical protein ABIT71_01515 [Vicinamibacteraceae bacterium]